MKCTVVLLLLSGACAVLGLSTELKDPLPDECRGGGDGNARKLDGGDCERQMDGICYNPTCRNCVDGQVFGALFGFCGDQRRACCAPLALPQPNFPCDAKGGTCMLEKTNPPCRHWTGNNNDCQDPVLMVFNVGGPFCCLAPNFPCDRKGGTCMMSKDDPPCPKWTGVNTDCEDPVLNVVDNGGRFCCLSECEDRGGICMDHRECSLSRDGYERKRGWCPNERGTRITCCMMDRGCRDRNGECLRVIKDRDVCARRTGHNFDPNPALCGGAPDVQCCKR